MAPSGSTGSTPCLDIRHPALICASPTLSILPMCLINFLTFSYSYVRSTVPRLFQDVSFFFASKPSFSSKHFSSLFKAFHIEDLCVQSAFDLIFSSIKFQLVISPLRPCDHAWHSMVTFVDEILAQSEFRDFAVPAFDASAYADTILAAPEESPFHGLDLGKSAACLLMRQARRCQSYPSILSI